MSSTTRTIALTIAGTVGATIVFNLLASFWNLPTRVQRLEDEEVYYHGDKWPPPNGGRVAP